MFGILAFWMLQYTHVFFSLIMNFLRQELEQASFEYSINVAKLYVHFGYYFSKVARLLRRSYITHLNSCKTRVPVVSHQWRQLRQKSPLAKNFEMCELVKSDGDKKICLISNLAWPVCIYPYLQGCKSCTLRRALKFCNPLRPGSRYYFESSLSITKMS